jgi:hypothetical protein
MSSFSEIPIHEYPGIEKRKTFSKTVTYRIRVVRRLIDGIPRILLDIREYIVTEKRSMFTEGGVYFTLDELRTLISTLQDSLQYFKRRDDVSGDGNRTPYTGLPKTED